MAIKKVIKYEYIKRLHPDKLRMVKNALLTGTPPLTVARMIHGWGVMKTMKEHILAKQLVGFKEELAVTYEDDKVGTITILPIDGSMDVLTEMKWLALTQRKRLDALLEAERLKQKHSGTTSTEMSQYALFLKDLLKAEFEAGEREFKGPTSGKGLQAKFTVDPSGAIQVEVKEAVEAATSIMKRVPLTIEAQRVD